MSEKHDVYECRACLKILDSKENLIDLFQAWRQPWEGMKNTIAEDLAIFGNIQLSTSDRHSKVICDSCFKKLQAACNFTAVVKKSDTILSQRYQPIDQNYQGDTVWPKPIQLNKNVNGTVFETTMDIEIKQEVLSDNECGESTNGNSDGHEKEIKDSVEIKIEPEEMTRPPPFQINDLFTKMSKSQDDLRNSKGSKLTLKMTDRSGLRPTAVRSTENVQMTEMLVRADQQTAFKDMKNRDKAGKRVIAGRVGIEDRDTRLAIPFHDEFLEAPLKEEPTSEVDSDAMSTADLPLECMLCCKAFQSVSGLKAHVIAQHSYKSVKRKPVDEVQSPSKKKNQYVCATCRRSFVTSTDLMVHETCHNKATCYGCNQKFETFEHLTRHRVRCTVIINKELPKPKTLEDVKRTIAAEHKCLEDEDLPTAEQLQCHLCPEKFSDSYYMKIHQEIHHNPQEQAPPPQSVAPMETATLERIFSEDK